MKTSWYFGRQVVLQILSSELKVKRILLAQAAEGKNIDELRTLAAQKKIALEHVSKNRLDSLCRGNHQGVAVEVILPIVLDFKEFLKSSPSPLPPHQNHWCGGESSPSRGEGGGEGKGGGKGDFIVLLDEVQDPQNLGAILRSALCFGCSAIILPKWRSAHLTEGVMKASSGAAAHLPIFQVTNLSYAIEQLKEKGYYIYGAALGGIPLPQVKFEFPLALILGNEHRGIKPLIKKNCDQLVAIPQSGTMASLNVSTAAAIFFYEISKAER